MSLQDLAMVLQWRNNREIRQFMYTQHEIGFEEHRAWFNKASLDNSKYLLIFESNNTPTGYVNFSKIRDTATADWGFYLAPDSPKGTGRQLGVAALDYAFEKLGLDKVYGEIVRFNKRSIKFHQNLGFMQESIIRNNFFDGKLSHDVMRFSLPKEKWYEVDKENL